MELRRGAVTALAAGAVVALGFEVFSASAPAQSAQAQVHSVVVRYDRAFADGRYRAACALLSPTARRDVASFGPGGCPRQLLHALGFTRAQARGFAAAGVSAADVRGDFANVTIAIPGQPTNGATLHREKGRWLIAWPPAAISAG
jgi:hypothetical protein